MKLFLFPERFKKLTGYLRIFFIVFVRIFKIIFQRKRKIQKVNLEYFQNWHFDKAYLSINMKFRNVIWVQIGSRRYFDFSEYLFLDLSKFTEDRLIIKVYGFFQVRKFEIYLRKENVLNSVSFFTSIHGLEIDRVALPQMQAREVKFSAFISKPKLELKNFSLLKNELHFNYKPFNTQDHI